MHPILINPEKYIIENKLFNKDHKLLIAISGGCDSTALTYLLHESGYNIKLAHCNFKLRAEESDKDEAFVRDIASNLNLELFVTSFDTSSFAEKNKYSVEEAARILRYDWFESLRKKHNTDYILTAHHLNDKIETFFINLIAGTGIRGLRSIQAKNGYIIRPLLFAEQNEIKSYCKENNISYRIDKSNLDTNFVRNKIRHEIIPRLKEINPNISDTMSSNFDILNDLEEIYINYINNNIKKIVKSVGNHVFINIEKLLRNQASMTLLFEIIAPYGFNSSQTKDILSSLPHLQTGKVFLSRTYKILKDRNDLIISKIENKTNKNCIITSNIKFVNEPIKLIFERIKKSSEEVNFSNDNNIALLDADKIKYPLTLRTRKEGDYFCPLGMSGKKLISDFFTDIKLNRIEKDKTYLLISDNKIVWITGHRIDDRFKITNKTKNILKIERIIS
ncbi:MAG: tRNA lysidine(34) synthetase TilS [Bacteroidales bacterium]|nr:tRNA lysidine(34) synthetase TilS [Bacteroidales bacterium]